MWDYDKLFAEWNVVGIKNSKTNKIYIDVIDTKSDKEFYIEDCGVNTLDYSPSNEQIQYIIRLDEHGNVVEKLFDRDRDMLKPMPELKTGMFVRVTENNNMKETILGYVDVINCRIIYQDGKYNDLANIGKLKGIVDIVEVYSVKTLCFNRCFSNETLIWRSPEYQDYLDSKSK